MALLKVEARDPDERVLRASTRKNPGNPAFRTQVLPENHRHHATALDYDPSATATKRFFAAVQNKMHCAVHGQTAAEIIVDRADHQRENMGLTQWEDAPKGKIHRYDVSIAKNYLSDFDQMIKNLPPKGDSP
jgi:hypothetical protein